VATHRNTIVDPTAKTRMDKGGKENNFKNVAKENPSIFETETEPTN
jgi:hypothetical protein